MKLDKFVFMSPELALDGAPCHSAWHIVNVWVQSPMSLSTRISVKIPQLTEKQTFLNHYKHFTQKLHEV